MALGEGEGVGGVGGVEGYTVVGHGYGFLVGMGLCGDEGGLGSGLWLWGYICGVWKGGGCRGFLIGTPMRLVSAVRIGLQRWYGRWF